MRLTSIAQGIARNGEFAEDALLKSGKQIVAGFVQDFPVVDDLSGGRLYITNRTFDQRRFVYDR